MKLAITGHRPEKIPDLNWVSRAIDEMLERLAPSQLIQGMAAGVDLLSAERAFAAGIPFVCVRPWAGHKPRISDRKLYKWALDNAVEVVNVHESSLYPGPWVYQKRNEWMVDNADGLLAIWDGSTGGTFNCVSYAKSREVHIDRIDPVTKRIGPWPRG